MTNLNTSNKFNQNDKKMSSNKKGIVLPWFVPGLPLMNEGIKTKLSFDIWAWANTRDSMYIFSLPHCNVVSSRGISIKDPRYTMMQVSKSMWNIQGYANQEKWDSVAMEGRIILESVCAYLNRYRPVQLNSAINEAIHNYPQIEEELNFVRQIGCLGVHFQDNMDSFRIFRTTQKSAFTMIQAVYNLIKKMEDIIYHDYNTERNDTLKKLTNLRNKLSRERLNCKSNVEIKVKSCADEAKPKGCRKKKHLGCPYLHKGDCQFNIEDAKKNLQMLRDYKNTLRDTGMLNDEDNCDSDNSFPSEYDSFTDRFNVDEQNDPGAEPVDRNDPGAEPVDERILCGTVGFLSRVDHDGIGVPVPDVYVSTGVPVHNTHLNTVFPQVCKERTQKEEIKIIDYTKIENLHQKLNTEFYINTPENSDDEPDNLDERHDDDIQENQFKDILEMFDTQIRFIITA